MQKKNNYICNLVIFGVKGDLSKKKLIPAIYQLEYSNMLHKETRIIGVGRANWNTENFLNMVKKTLDKFLDYKIDNNTWIKLSNRLIFCNLDITEISNFNKLKKILSKKNHLIIYYLAVPPNLFCSICQGLGILKLNHSLTRIIIEKPLGTSFKTSQQINNELSKYFNENQIFRIDHYLGKETILNLLTLRFANSILFNNWNKTTIDHIQITVSEQIGIEGRWEYFDKSGQIRDMVQNHLLQILTIITMAPPINLETNNIRHEKIKILRALRKVDLTNFKQNVVLGQYTSGTINGKIVPSYIHESNTHKISNTETFVAIKTYIDNHQWNGVPIYLRTGKRLPIKCSEIVIHFKKPTINLFEKQYNDQIFTNQLIIKLQPNEGIILKIINKVPNLNYEYVLKNVNLEFKYSNEFYNKRLPEAYERLLLASIQGIQTLFVSREEIEASWIWVDNIINTRDKINQVPLKYQAGTWGSPDLFEKIIQKDGRKWHISM
ncbi:glucose-6-phosphate dehydrogenase [Buchnera aphidicola (Formosaphis micheliae)]|uniref:glucose-6-phosphate dehydrogenase n=1 Tax=Buchnera aphidicola TaxID=9 RepID=UPI0031B8224E